MTPIALPLVMSLVSLGFGESGLQPSADIWSDFAGSRYLPQVDEEALASASDSQVLALSDSAYPEAYRWTQDEASIAPVDMDGPAVKTRVPVNQAAAQDAESDSNDAPDHDFDLTPGVGLVGVGFVWRYR